MSICPKTERGHEYAQYNDPASFLVKEKCIHCGHERGSYRSLAPISQKESRMIRAGAPKPPIVVFDEASEVTPEMFEAPVFDPARTDPNVVLQPKGPVTKRPGIQKVETEGKVLVSMLEFKGDILVCATDGVYKLIDGELIPVATTQDFIEADRRYEERKQYEKR